MSAQKRFSVVFALGGLFVVILFRPGVEAFRHLEKESRLRAYETFLESHPFSRTSPGSRGDPRHPENPGERYRQEYLLMVDPALGRVPAERLAAANRSAKLLRRRRGAPGRPGANLSKLQVPDTAWEERGPDNVGGRTRAIMFDPNDPQNRKVWAGGVAGGLWYTDDITDPAEPWHNVDDFWSNLAISSLAYDPTDPMTFYAGTGEGFFNGDALQGGGVFKSIDGGVSWNHIASTSGSAWLRVQDVVVTEQGTVLAATRNVDGVLRSDDDGDSWTPVLDAGTGASTSRAADLEIAANGDIYATLGLLTTDGVWKSDDDGETWDKLNTGVNGFPTTGFHRIEIALAPSDSNRVYAVTQDASTFGVGGMYRSVDGGANWTSMALPVDCDGGIGADFTRGQAWYDLILAVKPDDEDVLLAGGIDLFRSDDAGTAVNWDQMSHWYGGCGLPYVHADQHAIAFRPGTTTEAVFGTDGGIYYTADVTDDPPVFVNRNKGYNVTQFYAVAQSPTGASNLMIGGTQDNGTPQLNAAGVSGQVDDVTGGDGAFTQINQTTNVLAMASNQWLNWHRSLDGGNTFSPIGGISGGGSFINPSDLDEDTNHLFFNFSSTQVGRLNGLVGGTVSADGFGPPGGFGLLLTHVRNSEFSPASTSTIYLGSGGGRIFRAANAHKPPPGPPLSPSWSELNTGPLPTGSISCIELGAGEDTLVVTFSNYGISSVWYTTDGGTNWEDLDAGSNLPDMPVWWALLDPFDPNALLIATEAGLWFTEDLTANPVVWAAEADIPITRVVMLKYRSSDNQLVLGTHGRGMWTATLSPPPPPIPDPRLVASVFLEGPYAGSGMMAVSPDFADDRPLEQPFSDPLFDGNPLEYDGADSVLSFPSGTIDWLLVELRSDPTAASLVADSKRPAILLQDGSVVGLDGDTLRFPGVTPDAYHVVFRHRNHLAVMTATTLDFAAGPVTVDLRTSLAGAYTSGGNAMKSLGGGLFGMFASDGSIDGQITAPDFNLWNAATTAGVTGYVMPDYNLDGIVTAPDFNLWNANTTAGASSQVTP
ncbi:MAG TPA: sialidase family protein [Rhodothermales bacterium]|nr:sialidase family protein [Rhodothermales bacterium]